MASWQLPSSISQWVARLAKHLHQDVAWRLEPMLVGVLFARGRRTVTSWLRAAGLQRDFQPYYYFLGSLGRKTCLLGCLLLHIVLKRLGLPERVLLALDDTPTKRYGRHVEGAGIHHNPTPGPADQTFLYGHVWVTLAWIAHHPLWGTIALPLWASLYVRVKDIMKLARYRWKFRTKLALAAEMVEEAAWCLRLLACKLWVVVDGGYAKRVFLRRVLAKGVVVVSRLRKDARLYSVPKPPKRGERRRGRPRKYGAERIVLAKRAGQQRGWETAELVLYGKPVTKTYKTFLATYPPVGGIIRVALVKEDEGWRAFFCTDDRASVAEILQAVADRGALEQTFCGVKEVGGAGQQQLRNLWANIAAWHLNLWAYTLVELWAWCMPHEQVCDRSGSPWDDPTRRPSHADKRNALRRHTMRDTFSIVERAAVLPRKIRALIQSLLQLAA
jgi:hypothetical protein